MSERKMPEKTIPYRFSKDDPDRARKMQVLGAKKSKENFAKKKALLQNISLVLQAQMDVSPEMRKTLNKMGIKNLRGKIASGTLATARILQKVIATGDYKGFESLLRISGHTYDQIVGAPTESNRIPDQRPKFNEAESGDILRRMGVDSDV